MFANNDINGIHKTRYIMSWLRAGGSFSDDGEGYSDFRDWLKSLGLTKEEIEQIMFLAMNGKLELEVSAKRFLKTLDRE